MISENGPISTELEKHLHRLHKALDEGVDVTHVLTDAGRYLLDAIRQMEAQLAFITGGDAQPIGDLLQDLHPVERVTQVRTDPLGYPIELHLDKSLAAHQADLASHHGILKTRVPGHETGTVWNFVNNPAALIDALAEALGLTLPAEAGADSGIPIRVRLCKQRPHPNIIHAILGGYIIDTIDNPRVLSWIQRCMHTADSDILEVPARMFRTRCGRWGMVYYT